METEIKAKWIILGLDVLRTRLREAGAKMLVPER